MVVEGVQDNMWMLKNSEEINHPVIKEYQEEVARVTAKAEKEGKAAKDSFTRLVKH